MAELRVLVEKAAQKRRLARTNRELQRQIHEKFGFEGVVGSGPKMHEVIARLQSIAPTSANVMSSTRLTLIPVRYISTSASSTLASHLL